MSGFIKTIDQTYKNGIVDAKTYETIRRALFEKLEFGVIRAQGLGDVLMCLPVIRALKKRNPGSTVSFYSFPQYLPLLKRFECIDKLGTLEEIDTSTIIIDLMGKIDYLPLCNRAHRIELLADEAGLSSEEVDPYFYFSISPEEREWAAQFLHAKGVTCRDKVIGVHLKSYADIRTWEGNWDLVRIMLRRLPKNYKIMLFEKDLVCPPKDIRSNRVVNLTGTISIPQLVPLIASCNLLVCPDSGAMHLAGMLEVPFIALFGPIDPDFRIRYYSSGEAIWLQEFACVPCWDWQTMTCVQEEKYKLCMRKITPEMVFERIRSNI